MIARNRSRGQMKLVRIGSVLLVAISALLLGGGRPVAAQKGQPACPRVANRGEITASKTGEMVPGDVHWYSWKVSSGDHQVWVQGADDLELILCTRGVAKRCSFNYGPVGDGCLATNLSPHPGFGAEVKGPADVLLGVSLCRDSSQGCIPSPLGSIHSPYALAVR